MVMLVSVVTDKSVPSPSKLLHSHLRCPRVKHLNRLCLPISNVKSRELGRGDDSIAADDADDGVRNIYPEVWCSSFRQRSVLLRDR